MNDLKYFTDKGLERKSSDIIFHGFFTRVGGVSQKAYQGLNCGLGSDDDAQHVKKNRDLVSEKAAIKPENLLSLYQVHGNRCLVVDEVFDLAQRPKGDAFITDCAGIGLGILTADCVPVLFYGHKKDGTPVIGAAHAGWKGALSGVLENTISCMIEKKYTQPESIYAVVGPCLLKKNFEVQPDFEEKFIDESDDSELFFSTDNCNRLVFDLSGYCAYRLSRVGVRNVTLMDVDTYSNDTLFYSYRRATHKNEKEYGRQISVISIRN
ncbi:MAG: peptidoglycan editing factor PgeF [Alphaproteobacteria bacterium]|nr:peptidoglycan editing factor PgeF [Alphaproteobacteria bacterium]